MKGHSRITKEEKHLLRNDTLKILFFFFEISMHHSNLQDEYNRYLYIDSWWKRKRQAHSLHRSKLNRKIKRKIIFLYIFQITSSSHSLRKFILNSSWANLQKIQVVLHMFDKMFEPLLETPKSFECTQSSDTNWGGIPKPEVQNESRKRLW